MRDLVILVYSIFDFQSKGEDILILFCCESLLLVCIVYFLFYIIYYKRLDRIELISPYECGFDPYSLTRLTFSYRFYIISILFIIFDIEISLILPIPFLVIKIYGFWFFFIFIFILIIGLLYEYKYGSLEWLRIL